MKNLELFLDSNLTEGNDMIAIRCCGREKCIPSDTYGPKIRSHYIIHCIISGKGCYSKDNMHYPLANGQGFLICPGEKTVYSADAEDPWEYCWVGFTGNDVEKILGRIGLDRNHPVFSFSDPHPENSIRRLTQIMNTPGSHEYAALSELFCFFSYINSPVTASKQRTDAAYYVQCAKNYIHEYYSFPITVQQVTEHIGIDRSYLFRIFRNATGQSVQQYILSYRLSIARHLIESGQANITEACYSCGFSSVNYFSRAFAQKFGYCASSLIH